MSKKEADPEPGKTLRRDEEVYDELHAVNVGTSGVSWSVEGAVTTFASIARSRKCL